MLPVAVEECGAFDTVTVRSTADGAARSTDHRKKWPSEDGFSDRLPVLRTYRLFCHSPVWRTQWLCGLRRGSAAARLLGLRVWIPPGAWMSVVSVECCQVERSLRRAGHSTRSPSECGVYECDPGTSQKRSRPSMTLEPSEQNCLYTLLYTRSYNEQCYFPKRNNRLVFVMTMQCVSLRRQTYNCHNQFTPNTSNIIRI